MHSNMFKLSQCSFDNNKNTLWVFEGSFEGYLFICLQSECMLELSLVCSVHVYLCMVK